MEIIVLNREQVRELYHVQMKRDFNSQELKPLELILNNIDSGEYIVYGLIEQDCCIAYAAFRMEPESTWTLLDYFAVSPQLRGTGIGSRFFRALMEDNPAYVLIEAEAPQCAEDDADRIMRNRRIAFYERCGCVRTGVTANVFGVTYDVLCYTDAAQPTRSTVRVKLLSIYHHMLPETLYGQVKLLT